MHRKQRAAPGWRAAFLRALAEGASIAQAARAAGIDPSSVHRVRQRDAGFAGDCARAREEGVARLAAGAPALAPDEVLRASADGRPRIQRAGPGQWSAAKEARFLEVLATTANVSAARRAVGVSAPAIYNRRERDAGFAARWRSALDHGWHRLEALLLENATAALSRPAGGVEGDGSDEGGSDGGGSDGGGLAPAMTVDQAITVYRMHQANVTGAGPRPRHDWRREPASLEEIQAEVLRRVRVLGGG